MGVAYSSCDGVNQVVHEFQENDEEKKGVVATIQETALEASAVAEDAVSKAVDQVDATADKVASLVVTDATETKETTDTVAATVDTVTDAIKEAAEDIADAVQELAKDAAEVVTATMDAAVAAVTGTMIVEFADAKGVAQRVCFATQKLGFATGLSGGLCCASKAKAKVVVKKVDKAGQAAKLGVKVGWKVCSIDGVEVTGAEQAQQLLSSGAAKLPKA
eukprot:243538_1